MASKQFSVLHKLCNNYDTLRMFLKLIFGYKLIDRLVITIIFQLNLVLVEKNYKVYLYSND